MTHDLWHALIHLSAAAVLLGGGGVVLARGWRARRAAADAGAAMPVDGLPPMSMARVVARAATMRAAALSLAAATIHLAAAPAHLAELGLVGWGFVAAAVFQAAWALAYAVNASARVAFVGIAGNAAIVAAWAWSRVEGLPVGALAGVPEPVGVPDAAASLFQVLLVALLVLRASGARLGTPIGRRFVRDPASFAVIAVVPAIGVVFLATTLAVTLALGQGHTPGPDHGHEPGAGHDGATPAAEARP